MGISLERLLRGQHFYTGLRIATGVLIIAFLVYLVAGASIAALVASGAICTSGADEASPQRHKPLELMLSWLLSSGVYWLIYLTAGNFQALAISIFVLSFLISFGSAFGKKALAIGFSGTFAIILGLGAGGTSLWHDSILFFVGGGLYVLYGVMASHFLAFRTRKQIFAECAFELSRFLRLKARFYEKGAKPDALYPSLLMQQALVADRLQSAREFVFRNVVTNRENRLAQLFIRHVDLFEYVLAGDTDYDLLQQYYSGSDCMLFLRDLVLKCADCVDAVAHTALRGEPVRHSISFKAEIFAIEHDLDRLSYDRSQNVDALTVLIDVFDKMVLCSEKIMQIRAVQLSPERDHSQDLSVRYASFVPRSSYDWRILRTNLRLRSPYLRYAFRAAIAMECGLFLAAGLNWLLPGVSSHSFWILLTISVVLRSNYSQTVQRRTDRIIGNTCGCLLTAVLLAFSPDTWILMIFLYGSTVAVNTFIALNYRFTAASASIMALLQIYFLHPVASFAFGERIIDTILGSLLAYACSFVLPSWEYRSMPQLADSLFKAAGGYMRSVLSLVTADEDSRIRRKRMFDALAEVTGAFDRMLLEPKEQHRGVNEIGRFITVSYLFGARMASIRVLLQRLRDRPAMEHVAPQVDAMQAKLAGFFALSCSQEKPLPWDAAHIYAQEKEKTFPTRESVDFAKSMQLRKMDYSEQHLATLLQQQLEIAHVLASELHELREKVFREQR